MSSYGAGHPPSLIRVLAVCMKTPWVLSGCPCRSQSSLGALVILLVLLCGGSYVNDDHLYDVIAVMLPLCLCVHSLLLAYGRKMIIRTFQAILCIKGAPAAHMDT